MAQIFIRVELRGNPKAEDYDRLHEFMATKNWYRQINRSAGVSMLPHATYQGSSDTAPVDIARALKTSIESQAWNSAVVLVMAASLWGMVPA